MKKLLSFSILLMLCVSAMAQTVTLTFTGRDAASQYVQLDRVTVTDQTKGWTETLLWPDTTLTMQNGTGIADYAHNAGFALSQNNPNPFNGTTDVNLTVADAGTVTLEIVDVNGRMVVETTHALSLPTGTHQFRVSLSAAGTYMMTARQNGKTSSIKMVNNGGGKDNRIEFVGTVQSITFVLKSTTTHPFDLGDMMEYAGFATINGVEYESDRISQAQNSSQTFMLRFDVARPEVTTQNATGITATAATLNGEVTDDHNANVTERGFCYGTTPSPSLNGSYMIVGNGTGSFSSGLAELTPATNYYVRAYATNMVGTSYGQQKVFRTLDTLPVVTTAEPSGITATTFTSGGEVTVLNSASLTARGVCWNTTGTPTLADSHTTQSGGLGSFTSIVEGLTCGTTYYVRAYATNNAGTAYGEEYNVTTTDTLPDVETLMAQVNATSSAIQSEVLSENCAAVTARGVCWNTAGTPTVADSHTTDGVGVGSFTSSLTNLVPATDYYVRAYATNSVGTAYGQIYVYHTLDTLPVVTTIEPSDIYTSSFVSGGEVTVLNSASLTARGVCWNTTGTPTVADSHTTESGDLGSFTSNVEGLSCGTTYYVRAYATNSMGTAYGEEYSMTTLTSTIPEIELSSAILYNGLNIVTQAEVLTENCATVTARGICWNTSPVPTINDNHTENGAGLGTFSDTITGLAIATTYYIRAYATNGDGIAYSDEVQVAAPDYPTVVTAAVTNITATTVTGGGNVTFDGGATVTARGVCWSRNQNPTIADSHTTNGSGTGSFTSSITGLVSGATYYVRAYATNSLGTVYGEQVVFDYFACGSGTLTDRSGNTYHTVRIGTQCWMKENLRTTRYADGTYISRGSDTSYTVAYWYYPNNSSSNQTTYGLLYNWKAVMRNSSSNSTNPGVVQGICPTGWHVPSDAEWKQMEMAVGMSQNDADNTGSRGAIAAKLSGNTGWTSSTEANAAGNLSASERNSSGFSALPAGDYYNGSYNYFGQRTTFWSATEFDRSRFWGRGLSYNSAGVSRYGGNSNYRKNSGYSVRCLRSEKPVVSTQAVTNITKNSAECGGEVIAENIATVTARGVCWSTTPNPTIADNHTNDGVGLGYFSSSLVELDSATTYYVRAYATNGVGTSYGEEMFFVTLGDACHGDTTLTDIDGNTYNTVQIGSQCWMKENLRTKKYADGSSIMQGSDTSSIVPLWYYPYNNINYATTYGLLYNCRAVMGNYFSSNTNPSGVQGICPTGWHVPSNAEWIQLTDYVSSQSQYWCDGDSTNIARALASATTDWNYSSTDPFLSFNACVVGYNRSTNNATGFSARPAGSRSYSNNYSEFGTGTRFRTATMNFSSYRHYSLMFGHSSVHVGLDQVSNGEGGSVRCLRDEVSSTAPFPTVTTTEVSDLTNFSAICGGNVTDDGGLTVTSRGVCFNTTGSPTIYDSRITTDGNGLGSFTSTLTALFAGGTTYYVRAYASNSLGVAYGEEISFSTPAVTPCPNAPTLTDRDGNTYNTVQIGNQCWMKENLRTTKYADNTEIPAGSTTSYTDPYRYAPNNDEGNVPAYGYLYNWPAVMRGASSSDANPSGVQGICPTGWHVPSDAEFRQLGMTIGMSQSEIDHGNDKAVGFSAEAGWQSSTTNNTPGNPLSPGRNHTGFSALPAGYSNGTIGSSTVFWSATESSSSHAYFFLRLFYSSPSVDCGSDAKRGGFSVRCVKD